MFKFKNTLKQLGNIGVILRKGLQDELKAQKHNATGRLSRGLRYEVKGNVLNVMSSASYWKAVNNPLFAAVPNLSAIQSWMNSKNMIGSPVPILRKLKDKGYGKPYSVWTEGNRLRRTDFAGYTARKFKDKIVDKLAPSIGKDVADMIAEQIKKNNPKTNVQKAF